MSRRTLCLVSWLVLLLAAGCGQPLTATPAPTATIASSLPPTIPTLPPPTPDLTATRAAYPSPPAVPTQPPPTPEPTATPQPTPELSPRLVIQPLPEELRSGERIAFLKDGDLWLVRPDGSGLAQVSTSANVSAIFGWSWDNSHLLLTVRGASWLDLWALSADGSSAQQITREQNIVLALWSPVDPSFVYGTAEGRLCVADLEGRQTCLPEERGASFQESAWSPDGTRLALLLLPADWRPYEFVFSTDIGVWNIENGTVTNLTAANEDVSRVTNYYPIWSLDGSRILFHSEQESHEYQFWYVMDSDGSNLQHLDTPPFAAALRVVRSPVADQVVMNLAGEVWLLDFNGQMRKIANTIWPCCHDTPYSWSPDGRKLALVEPDGRLVQIDVSSLAVEVITEMGDNPAWTH